MTHFSLIITNQVEKNYAENQAIRMKIVPLKELSYSSSEQPFSSEYSQWDLTKVS